MQEGRNVYGASSGRLRAKPSAWLSSNFFLHSCLPYKAVVSKEMIDEETKNPGTELLLGPE